VVADNEQWLADNHDSLVHNLDKMVPVPERSRASEATLADTVGYVVTDSAAKRTSSPHATARSQACGERAGFLRRLPAT